MERLFIKILFVLFSSVILLSCDAVKRVPQNEYLLEKNEIFVDSVKAKDIKLNNQLYQHSNARLLNIPLRLHIYNLAQINADSSYFSWLHKNPGLKKRMNGFLSIKQVNRLGNGWNGLNKWLKKTGETPVIVDSSKTIKSINRLQSYYWNNGWFNAEATYKMTENDKKKATVSYYIKPNQPYILDAVVTSIESRVADSIYTLHQKKSKLIAGEQYRTLDVDKERERLTSLYRNSGLYYFEKENIKFDADTVNTDHRINLNILINNRQVATAGTTSRTPFKIHKISEVNVFTDYNYQYRDSIPKDSILYQGYNIYSYDRMRYTRKAITNSVLITPGEIYRDKDRTRTYNQISNLRSFKYPSIQYEIDPKNPNGTDLIANILLTPRKKYSASTAFDVSTSNIQLFGIGFGGSLLTRNLFKGAEILEISGRGSVGSSRDPVNPDSEFFDISEIGIDFKLTFPKIVFPFDIRKIIPKYMSPTTNLILGINAQKNIGLDKQNASFTFNYAWKPKIILTNQLDILNIQYVRNLNTNNYFNIYRNSFRRLNDIAKNVLLPTSSFFDPENEDDLRLLIPRGANSFIMQSLGDMPNSSITSDQFEEIRNTKERKDRLTQDNLILSSSYTYIKNTRENLYDERYFRFKVKIESAGNILGTIADLANLEKNTNNTFSIFGVEFSQFVKLELDYIKHWDLGRKNIIAFRTFGGIAIPYGNVNNIPFARSFFGGGPNDNRAWSVYDLGPGSSGGRNEFNEANMKIAINLEYRFGMIGALKGAFFIDAGNIWNVLDNTVEEDAIFSNWSDLKEIAIGTGFGLRYDFDFFVVRFDVGFKTFDPANNTDQRWFKGYNFSKAVPNIGINYPF